MPAAYRRLRGKGRSAPGACSYRPDGAQDRAWRHHILSGYLV